MPFINRRDLIYWVSIFIFSVIGLALSLFIQHDFWRALSLGLSITDVSALAHTLAGINDLSNLLYIKRFDLCGLLVLYAPGYLLSPWFYPIINVALFTIAAWIYKKLIVDECATCKSFSTALCGICGNPFLLLTMPGPNKELPLLVLTLALCWLIIEKRPFWILYSVMVALLAWAFRDGYGAILLAFVLIYASAFKLRVRERSTIIISFLFCGLVVVLMLPMAEWISFLHRNMEVATRISGAIPATAETSHSWNIFGLPNIWGAWLKRVLLNAFTLAMFPLLQQTNGRIYWVGVGYWLFGIANFFALLAAGHIALKMGKNKIAPKTVTMATFWLSTWFMLSVSLYVQPRYMMVTMPIGIGLLSSLSIRIRLRFAISIALIIGATIAFYYMNQSAFSTVPPDTYPVNPYSIP